MNKKKKENIVKFLKKHTKEEQTAMWEKIKRAEKGGKDFTY